MLQYAPQARRTDVVVQEFADEILIYDLNTNKVFNLNKPAALIWQLSNGNKTVSDIAQHLSQDLNSPVNEEFVWLALEQLRKEKLIENEPVSGEPYIGMSRREMIRRAGLASAVALPVVYSLVAPAPVNAQSNCPNNMAPTGCPCTSNNDCLNFCCGISLTCVPTGTVAPGGPCRVNCECASGSCPPIAGPNICA